MSASSPSRRPLSLAISVASLLWWTYFGWLQDGARPSVRGRAAGSTGSARARCVQPRALSTDRRHRRVRRGDRVDRRPSEQPAPASVLASLGIGRPFVACSALSLRLFGGRILLPRLMILLVMLVALALVAAMPPVWPLSVVAAALLAIVVIEGGGPDPGPSRR